MTQDTRLLKVELELKDQLDFLKYKLKFNSLSSVISHLIEKHNTECKICPSNILEAWNKLKSEE